MNKPFWHIWAKSLKLIWLSLLLLTACTEQKMEVTGPPMDRNLPDETSSNVRITEFNGTEVDYHLEASRIDRFYDRRLLNAYKVKITAYDAKKGGKSVMQADSTIVDDARNLIYAYGNVKLNSVNGSIMAQRMIWDRNMDEVTAPGEVTLLRDGNTLRGSNLRTNTRIDYAEMDVVSAEGRFNESDFDW